ncbi:MAG: hypothetical protein Q8L61_00130 [Hyphomicrobium sp.]|nr:hypothetical protein [Hyphomicrobium sp.]
MTRSSLDKTLRRAYIVLGLVLLIAIIAKFADRIPGIEGTALARIAADTYEFLKDMSLVLVTVVAAYLANVFQKRSKFIERLEEEWRGIVRTKSALYSFCENQKASPEDYLLAFTRISETIDNMRVVYGNVGETDEFIGLYPFAPLHDMRRALQFLNPRKRTDISIEERRLARDAVLQSFYALRESFIGELEIGEPDDPIVVSVARRLPRPGVDARGRRIEGRQLEKYQRSDAPRNKEVEDFLWALHAKEQAG